MKDFTNDVHVEGYVFSHSLQERVAKKTGTPFIMGDIQIATDDNAMNVVSVHFSYVTEKYSKSGNDNPTYGILSQIMQDSKTYETAGIQAPRVRIDGSLTTNDFWTRDWQLATPKRIEGSFCHLMNAGQALANDAATFKTDMLISGAELHELEAADDYLEVKGYVFNFRGDIFPVSFSARSKEAINYFQSQDYPMLTNIWGNINSTTIENKAEVESAFGGPAVNTTTRTLRSWDIVGAAVEPFDYPSDGVLTEAELKQAMANREQKLADDKARKEEYVAQRDGKSAAFPAATASASPTAASDFKF